MKLFLNRFIFSQILAIFCQFRQICIFYYFSAFFLLKATGGILKPEGTLPRGEWSPDSSTFFPNQQLPARLWFPPGVSAEIKLGQNTFSTKKCRNFEKGVEHGPKSCVWVVFGRSPPNSGWFWTFCLFGGVQLPARWTPPGPPPQGSLARTFFPTSIFSRGL